MLLHESRYHVQNKEDMAEIINLMYHDVISPEYPHSGFQKVGALQYTLEASTFEDHVKTIAGNDNVVFTFDDGGSCFYSLVASILERHNRRGIFFISTRYIGSQYFLTAEEIKRLDERGHIIASHSHTHPNNMALMSREECLQEWKESKMRLEEIIGHPINTASLPGGAMSDDVLNTAIEAGFTKIYTSVPTTNITQMGKAEILGRYGITSHTTKDKLIRIIIEKKKRDSLYMKYLLVSMTKRILGSRYNDVKQFLLKIRRKAL